MTLPLTPETLQAAYDYLKTTPPFNRWNLPDGEDVRFKVMRSRDVRGWYWTEGERHWIGISSHCIGRTDSLMSTMSHEMLHLHERQTCIETKAQHSRAFSKLAARVCGIHGFDAKLF